MKYICTFFLIFSLCLSLSSPTFAEDLTPLEIEDTLLNSAAFIDAGNIVHWEAVAALTKLGIIKAQDDGMFHPEELLTRAEAAMLCIHALNTQVPHPENPSIFSDTQGHWAEPYISFCTDLHIVSGRGDGTFDPDSPITGLEMLKMALAALGYNPEDYKLVGELWARQVDTLARSTDPSLYDSLAGVFISQPITRDNAAQILYNALNATVLGIVGVHRYYDDGRIEYEYAYAKRKDGTPASLLYIFFGLDEVGPIPQQSQ